MEKKQIIVNNLLLTYYLSLVEESDITLLFLHGWRSESSVWFKLMDELRAEGISCIALDLPGFGESQVPETSLTMSDFALIVNDFMIKLNLDNVILVGHSHGGATSIKLLSGYTTKVIKLVLVDSAGIRAKSFDKLVKNTAAKVLKPVFSPQFMQNFKKKIYRVMGSEDYVEREDLKGTLTNVLNEDLTGLLSLIKIPALIIVGEEDKDTPTAHAEIMNKEIEDSEMKIIDSAGHYSFLDNPELFKKILLEFINK